MNNNYINIYIRKTVFILSGALFLSVPAVAQENDATRHHQMQQQHNQHKNADMPEKKHTKMHNMSGNMHHGGGHGKHGMVV